MDVFVVLLAMAGVMRVTAMAGVVRMIANICEWYNLTLTYGGRYRPGEGDVTRKLLPHQCRCLCFHTP